MQLTPQLSRLAYLSSFVAHGLAESAKSSCTVEHWRQWERAACNHSTSIETFLTRIALTHQAFRHSRRHLTCLIGNRLSKLSPRHFLESAARRQLVSLTLPCS